MESFHIYGRLYGKTSTFWTASSTRALLPLPSVLVVVDAMAALKLHELTDRVCVPPRGIMFGARKGTQVLDVAHAAQLHLQKSGDSSGIGCLAQGDIATYYDKLSCMKVAQWFTRNGGDLYWASAFLRLQALPVICLSSGESSSFTITQRSLGTFTGSRSAVAAGRIPVETVACIVAADVQPYGVDTGLTTVVFASWVDNYYTFGSSVPNAISIAERFEEVLLQNWALDIKPTSRSLLSPAAPSEPWNSEKWPLFREADVLGHLLSGDSSPWPCWRRTEKSMWASFWKNCIGPKVAALGLNDRCRLLNRSVKPILSFRNTRWPWTRTLSDCQSRTQRRMLSYFLHVQRWPDESLNSWHRRRMRQVANAANESGNWGRDHAQRVLTWSDHLQRERNNGSLAAALFCWHDHHWLEARRLDPGTGGPFRPGTRASPGPVVKRWDEALQDARAHVQ